MPRLAAAALTLALAAGCGDGQTEGERYLADSGFRRARLEASLVNPANGYSRLRLEHYATGHGGDWDALPAWNPPAFDGTTLDLTQTTRADGLLDLGMRAFSRYPAQLTATDAPGLVAVRFADGSEGRALTCASCHARMVDGELVVGLANQAIDLGWGPGRIDVAPLPGEEPVAIPDLRPVAFESHLQRDGAVRNDLIALAIRIETLIITAHSQTIRPPREVALGLAAYLWSLAPPAVAAPPVGTAAERGAARFAEQCVGCHVPPTYAGPPVPLEVVGTDPRVGQSLDRGTGGYRVPSLRGVSSRGALLHDGSVQSLPGLFDPTRSAVGHPFGLDLPAGDRADLLAFLAAL